MLSGDKYPETLDIESTSFIISDRQLEEGMWKEEIRRNFLCSTFVSIVKKQNFNIFRRPYINLRQ